VPHSGTANAAWSAVITRALQLCKTCWFELNRQMVDPETVVQPAADVGEHLSTGTRLVDGDVR
jgi:hypothetical protein